MNNEIFRKKSIDSINSPEDLNSFLRITNPPLWIILSAIVLLLAGAIVWGCTNTIDTKAPCVVISDGTETFCYIHTDDLSYVSTDTEIVLDDMSVVVTGVSDHGAYAETLMNEYQMILGSFEKGETAYCLSVDRTLPEGNYEASVIVERISPISFLWNSSN